jgi:hypothetical protein
VLLASTASIGSRGHIEMIRADGGAGIARRIDVDAAIRTTIASTNLSALRKFLGHHVPQTFRTARIFDRKIIVECVATMLAKRIAFVGIDASRDAAASIPRR